jgi:hypothetical protein
MSIPNPIAVVNSEGILLTLHCMPEERCNIDDANNVEHWGWAKAFNRISVLDKGKRMAIDYLCAYCFNLIGGEKWDIIKIAGKQFEEVDR